MRLSALLFLLLPVSVLADPMMQPMSSHDMCPMHGGAGAGTITVHGEATTRVAPDRVTLPVTIHEENINLKLAKDKHDKKLVDLLKAAEELGISKENIQTSYTSINPQYDYPAHGKPKLLNYQVETSIDFKLDDISKLGDFMNKIIEAGITQIGDVSYSVKDEQKIKEDTLVTALNQAYEKASRLASTAKVEIDKPVEIDEGNVRENPYPPRPMAFANVAMRVSGQANPSAELPEGLVEIHQDVTVVYRIK